MNLYDYIWKRKSTRKYDMTPLGEEQISRIKQFSSNLRPLYPNIKIAYEITADVKGLQSFKAPHYFVVSSENSDGYLENAGFMFQQMSLYLSSLGIGSCWLGGAKPPPGVKTELPFVIILAFGKALDSPYRERKEFKRKPLTEISSGSDDRIEAARLAPSGVNFQNWFFEADNGKIDVYRKKTILGIYNRLAEIDSGIALCHLFAATEHSGKAFVFSKEAGKDKKGYIYIGTVN